MSAAQAATAQPGVVTWDGCAGQPPVSLLPVWARLGFYPAGLAMPHVMGEAGTIVAILWAPRDALRSSPLHNRNNKILWVSKVPLVALDRLVIKATLAGGTRTAAVSVPGGPGRRSSTCRRPAAGPCTWAGPATKTNSSCATWPRPGLRRPAASRPSPAVPGGERQRQRTEPGWPCGQARRARRLALGQAQGSVAPGRLAVAGAGRHASSRQAWPPAPRHSRPGPVTGLTQRDRRRENVHGAADLVGGRRDSITAGRPPTWLICAAWCTGLLHVLPGHPGCVRQSSASRTFHRNPRATG